MDNKELDVLLRETLGADVPAPAYLDTRLRGTLSLARREGRSVAIWWLPLAVALLAALAASLLAAALPMPLVWLAAAGAWASALGVVALTIVGLACFDLRRKGRLTI